METSVHQARRHVISLALKHLGRLTGEMALRLDRILVVDPCDLPCLVRGHVHVPNVLTRRQLGQHEAKQLFSQLPYEEEEDELLQGKVF